MLVEWTVHWKDVRMVESKELASVESLVERKESPKAGSMAVWMVLRKVA